MYNLNSFLPMFVFLTSFAEAYGEGTYNSGNYNEATSTTDSPTTSPTPAAPGSTSTPTTTQGSENPNATDDQLVSSADEIPRTTTTTQPTKQNNTETDTVSNTGMDPLWMTLIAASIVIAILATIFAITKKRRDQ